VSVFSVTQDVKQAHKVTHHDTGGLMWSSCTCGWKSRQLDAYHNYQVTVSRRAGELHQSSLVGQAISKELGLG
jgi:hypothetical protein